MNWWSDYGGWLHYWSGAVVECVHVHVDIVVEIGVVVHVHVHVHVHVWVGRAGRWTLLSWTRTGTGAVESGSFSWREIPTWPWTRSRSIDIVIHRRSSRDRRPMLTLRLRLRLIRTIRRRSRRRSIRDIMV